MGIQRDPSNGDQFDSIVLGELGGEEWISGSSNHERTERLNGGRESQLEGFDPNGFLHVAVTYSTDGTVTFYRNGAVYGSPYRTEVVSYDAEDGFVFFGKRHGVCTGRAASGEIDCAAVYDSALSGDAVAQSAERGCCGLSRQMGKLATGCQFCPDGQFHDDGRCLDVADCAVGEYVLAPPSPTVCGSDGSSV